LNSRRRLPAMSSHAAPMLEPRSASIVGHTLRKSGREMYTVVEARFVLETGPKSGFKKVSMPYTFLKPDLASKLKPEICFNCYFVKKHIGKAKRYNKLKQIMASILTPNLASKRTQIHISLKPICVLVLKPGLASKSCTKTCPSAGKNAPAGCKKARLVTAAPPLLRASSDRLLAGPRRARGASTLLPWRFVSFFLVSASATALERPRGARGRRSPPRRTVDVAPSVP
jgi:hypothetical protein